MRRLNRVVNKEESVYPPLISKSPLICRHESHSDKNNNNTNSCKSRARIVRGAPSLPFLCEDSKDVISELRRDAEKKVPLPAKVDQTGRLSASLLRRILTYVGDTPRDLVPFNSLNRAWRQASLALMDEVSFFPDIMPFDVAGETKTRKLKSFKSFLSSARGQHVRRLTIVDSHCVYQLSQQMRGPEVRVGDITGMLSLTPNLSVLDVRGIVLSDFVPITDRFLSNLHLLTPCLRTLKIGASFLRNWQPQWWTRLPYLSEFVVGSRREDADWDDMGSPLHLHDDFYSMIRSPAHVWVSIKLWVPLTSTSFSALLLPTMPIARVAGLTLNALGNCHIKPLDEGVVEIPKDEKKRTDKVPKKASQLEEQTTLKGTYPSLVSFTIADVTERPEFSTEVMGKMMQQAPCLKHFNVTNTQRTAPTHIEPPTAGKGRRLRRGV